MKQVKCSFASLFYYIISHLTPGLGLVPLVILSYIKYANLAVYLKN